MFNKIKKPTDDELRRQINISKKSMLICYIISWVGIFVGVETGKMVAYAISIIFYIIFLGCVFVSQKFDKIRLEIRELKR